MNFKKNKKTCMRCMFTIQAAVGSESQTYRNFIDFPRGIMAARNVDGESIASRNGNGKCFLKGSTLVAVLCLFYLWGIQYRLDSYR